MMTGPVGIPGPFWIFLGKEKVHGELIIEQRVVGQNNRVKDSQLSSRTFLQQAGTDNSASTGELWQPHASVGKKVGTTLAMCLFNQVYVCLLHHL